MLFKTKSQTLEFLQKKLSNKIGIIPKLYYFKISDYKKNKDYFLKQIKLRFDSKIIIRSSSIFEDSSKKSLAGSFESILNINSQESYSVEKSILAVINSYKKKYSNKNEILVQDMISNVNISGVATSGDKDNLSSYYLIDYNKTKDTTSITSGNKLNESFVFYKNSKQLPKNLYLKKIIILIHKLIAITNFEFIDIEFAIDKKKNLYLFQCRKIVPPKSTKKIDINFDNVINKFQNKIQKIQKPSIDLYGDSTLLSVMSDWNPAEMIGVKPKILAQSLYQELITDDVWAKNRAYLGYKTITGNPLMFSIFGTPYIDLRTDFNSWIPSNLSDNLSTKLVNYYLFKLKRNLHFHDKIEFNIVFTSYNFLTKSKIKELKKYKFKTKEINLISNSLHNITTNLIKNYSKNIHYLNKMKSINNLIEKNNLAPIEKINFLVKNIKKYGTFVFSTYARCGFVAKEFLDSFVELKIINKDEKNLFLSNIKTISSELNNDYNQLDKINFIKKYGHIRPNTYDILSLNYKDGYSIYFDKKTKNKFKSKNFKFSLKQLTKIKNLLKNNKIRFTSYELIEFIKDSIKNREYSKYIFSKSIDLIFQNLKLIAKRNKIPLNDIPFISIKDILTSYNNLNYLDLKVDLEKKIELNKKNFNLNQLIKLPQIITNKNDIIYYSQFKNEPNFIGTKKTTSKVYYLKIMKKVNLDNKIVCIENADPGFDFIFQYKISGIITKFGGVNSHMSIRCSELSIPGVIGVGDRFDKIKESTIIQIDPYNKKINII